MAVAVRIIKRDSRAAHTVGQIRRLTQSRLVVLAARSSVWMSSSILAFVESSTPLMCSLKFRTWSSTVRFTSNTRSVICRAVIASRTSRSRSATSWAFLVRSVSEPSREVEVESIECSLQSDGLGSGLQPDADVVAAGAGDLEVLGECCQHGLAVGDRADGGPGAQPVGDRHSRVRRDGDPSAQVVGCAEHGVGGWLNQPGASGVVGPRPSLLGVPNVPDVVEVLPPGGRCRVEGQAAVQLDPCDEDVHMHSRAVRPAVLDRGPAVPIGGQARERQRLEVGQDASDLSHGRPVVGMERDHGGGVAVDGAEAVGHRSGLGWVADQDLDVVAASPRVVPFAQQVRGRACR